MNIYDIAKEAGVSISTVSRVMNNKGNVNAATRKKVEAILDKHDYTPSAIARGMVSKTMKTVAVLTVDIRVPHYARTVYTIEREFSHRGYEVAICNTGGELEETAKYLKTMLEKKVDGIVLVGSIFNTLCKKDEIGNMIKNTPVVLANGKLELPNSYSVLVDDRYGVSLAVEHLLKRGHLDMYYLKDMDTVSARLKSEGFIKALESHGVSDAKQYVIDTDRSIGGGIEAVEKLIRCAGKLPAESKHDDHRQCGKIQRRKQSLDLLGQTMLPFPAEALHHHKKEVERGAGDGQCRQHRRRYHRSDLLVGHNTFSFTGLCFIFMGAVPAPHGNGDRHRGVRG